MTLAPGARLGPYELLAPLGAGGMGEVWRARDPKLEREVAIKVLPERLAGDAQALARFESEARAVAALSHPAILEIHDFGRDGEVAYAVTELLEGETLRERLADGPLALRKVLELGAQIARGLAAAHERDIVHRDLKPENLFLTHDGRAKILDFGLAKQQAPLGSASQLANSPTEGPLTEPGAVLGTVGYMSPEQVRGQQADAPSDLFALGAVLYELASGRRAFTRETAAETMTAILREEPPGLDDGTSGLAPGLERVVRHCLEKNPNERFRSAHDLAFALEALAGGGTTTGAAALAEAVRPRGRGAGRALALAAVAAALVVAGFFAGRAGTGVAQVTSSRVGLPARFVHLTDGQGIETQPTLSPDGKTVAYVAERDGRQRIYAQRIGGMNAIPIGAGGDGDDWAPAFSPDGERIAFRSEREGGGIFLMGSTGESVRRLTDFGFDPSWSPDGKEIVVAPGGFSYPTDVGSLLFGLVAVEVASEARRTITDAVDAKQPRWSPHGHRIAYWGLRANSGQRDLWTIAADGSEREGVAVTDDAALDWNPVWSPDGRFLYFSSDRGGTLNLWRVPIDERSGAALGPVEPVTTPSLWSGYLSFSADGRRLAFASVDWRSTLVSVPFDPAAGRIVGAPVPILKSTQVIRDHQLSPDGAWIVYVRRGEQEDLFVARVDGGEVRRLTDDDFRNRGPSWSPDGREIAFFSDRSGKYEIWTIRADGSGLAQRSETEGAVNFPVWSPEGRTIVAGTIPGEWYWIDLATGGGVGASRRIANPSPRMWFWPNAWSRDGRRLAGIAFVPGRVEVQVATYEPATARYWLDDAHAHTGYAYVRWLADGRRLVTRDTRAIELLDTATGEVRRLVTVGGFAIGVSVGVGPGDRSITYTETGTEGDVWLAELE